MGFLTLLQLVGSHHNIVGSRYGDQRLRLREKAPITESGFAIEADIAAAKYPAVTTFQAPSTVSIETKIDDEGSMQTLELYCSPSMPGFCNHIGRQVITKPKNGKMPQLLRQFTLPLPKWMLHVMASAFLNQVRRRNKFSRETRCIAVDSTAHVSTGCAVSPSSRALFGEDWKIFVTSP